MDASITKANYLTARRSGIVARNSEHGGAIRGEKGERRKEGNGAAVYEESSRNVSLRRYNEAPRRPRRRMFWPSQLLVISVSGRMVAAPVSGAVVEKGGREKTIEIPRFHEEDGEKTVQRGNSTEKKARWFLDKPLYRGQRTH